MGMKKDNFPRIHSKPGRNGDRWNGGHDRNVVIQHAYVISFRDNLFDFGTPGQFHKNGRSIQKSIRIRIGIQGPDELASIRQQIPHQGPIAPMECLMISQYQLLGITYWHKSENFERRLL